MHGGYRPSIKLVKTTVMGCCTRIIAVKVPFIYKTGAVARRTYDLCYGSIFWQQIGASDNYGVATSCYLLTGNATFIAKVVTYA